MEGRTRLRGGEHSSAVADGQGMVMTAHRHAATLGVTAQPAILRAGTGVDGIAADIQVAGAEADAETGTETGPETGIAEACRDGGASGIPYPTLDQVEQSFAIQRLQWLRHLPAPRTTAENRVFQRIRTLGWSAPDETGRDRNEAHS